MSHLGRKIEPKHPVELPVLDLPVPKVQNLPKENDYSGRGQFYTTFLRLVNYGYCCLFSGGLVCQFPTHERFSSSYSIELFSR